MENKKGINWVSELKDLDINILVGKTIVSIEGMEKDSDRIIIRCSDGEDYIMYHEQECCESVCVTDVCGDVQDLIGSKILKAECSTNESDNCEESFTWTFYKFATIKGSVDLRWYGESNGYYSESVEFREYIDGFSYE